jgi:hypothetical protein
MRRHPGTAAATRRDADCALMGIAGLLVVDHCLSTFPARAVYLPGSGDFRIRSTKSIVFQLRAVAGAPKGLSIWPR